MASNKYDKLFLHINIYRMGKNGSEENILQEPIYINLAKKDVGNAITLGLCDRNIYLNSNVLLSLELVRNLDMGGLRFSMGFAGSPSYFRKTSQATWKNVSRAFVFEFNATVTQEK